MLNYHSVRKLAIAIALTGTTFALLVPKAIAQVFSDAGFLDVGETVDHTFQGTAGQEVTISVESGDFDPYMTIYGPGGRFLVENDDANGTLNSMATVTLPRSGTYRIVVGGYDMDADNGRYFVRVDEAFVPPAALVNDTNFLSPGRFQQYFIDGTQGQTLNVALESSEFDPLLRVYDASNRRIAEVDDTNNSTNVYTAITLPRSGRYRIVVQGFSNSDSGQYTLSITE
ncbi:PPC domain-containing protein [Microcoleus sp. FACHB-1515]|uniref:PPC domain-containing protein n=1 Tax=Cyanophyceae TaxID=3028117 RepID=UPI001686467D|nr:PPC domain-containing protein [Microcoleus sp. FACHB-1515]MBD2088359.1 PPC domain-containing protein [Microcoleus sp. FACHB-1515]